MTVRPSAVVRLAAAFLLVVAVVLVLRGGIGRSEPAAADGTGTVVLVSGRDDHGLLADPWVTLAGEVGGGSAGKVRDGTLARVLDVDGQWLRVRTLEGPRRTGWLNDYYLRGIVRLVGSPPGCPVTVAGQRQPAGTEARVIAVADERVRVRVGVGDGPVGWVPRGTVDELPPNPDNAGGCA